MNLRWTILGIILLTFAGLVLVLSFSLQSILVPYFQDGENRSAQSNVQRVLKILENESENLIGTTHAWAFREDSYQYLITGDPQDIPSYISDSTLNELNIDLLALVTLGGEIAHADTTTGQGSLITDLPHGLQDRIQPGDPLLCTVDDCEPSSGLIVTDRGPLLIVSTPLLKSSGEGRVVGTLLVGRYLDNEELNRLSSVVLFPLTVQPYDQPNLPLDFVEAKRAITAEKPIAVIPSSESQMAAYTLLLDFNNQPAYVLKVEQGRLLFQNSQLVLFYLILAAVLGALLFSIMTFLALDQLVLARIRRLGNEVTKIGTGRDLSERVSVDHRDELTRVTLQINEMLANLQALSYRLVASQEDERRKIALELHDEIGQLLTGLKLQLSAIPQNGSTQAQPSLPRASALVDDLIQKVRNLSLDLRPTILDDLGLLPALYWHFDRYTSLTGVRVNFSQNGLIDTRFSPEIETTTYRIVQEALTNVARHSGTDEVSVQVLHMVDVLTIQVEDRGRGFTVETEIPSGRTGGLHGMQERVGLVGGSITIDAVEGWGTSILVELPAVALQVERSGDDHSYPGG